MGVVFLIPTLNEEGGIARVINTISNLDISNYSVLLIDKSTDKTGEIAKSKGAKVIYQKTKGKGNALHEAIATLSDEDIVVLTDGDETYDLSRVKEMLGLVKKDVFVYGKRDITRKSMTLFNQFGNFAFNTIASVLYRRRLTDMLTGLRVFYASTYKELGLKSSGFEIETEMTIKALKNKVKVIELPIKYYQRAGNTNLHPIKDGYRILKMVLLGR